MVNQRGNAAHPRGDCGAAAACALGQGIGEALGDRGQHVHVDCRIEAVGILHPAGKGDRSGGAELLRQILHLLALLAVAGDDEADLRAGLHRNGEAADQRAHVLDGVDARGDAEHGQPLLRLDADAAQIGAAVEGGRIGADGHAVEDDEGPVRIKAALVEHVHRDVRHADPEVHLAEGLLVDETVGHRGQRPAHVVEPVVAVDGGDRRQTQLLFQHGAHEVCPGAVAVDNLEALFANLPLQTPDCLPEAALHHLGRDAERPGLLHERSVHEADQKHLVGLCQPGEKGVHMCFCSADVAAGDQMDDFQINHSLSGSPSGAELSGGQFRI